MDRLIHWQDLNFGDISLCCLAPEAAAHLGIDPVCGRCVDCASLMPGAWLDASHTFLAEVSVLDLATGERVPLDVRWCTAADEAREFVEQWVLALTGDAAPPHAACHDGSCYTSPLAVTYVC